MAVDHYNTSVRLYNAHQDLIRAYNQAVTDAQGVLDDYDKSCTALENDYQGMSAANGMLSSADIVGGAVMGALGAKHTSILRRNAGWLADEAKTWQRRIANTDYSHPAGRYALDRDYKAKFDAQDRAAQAARDADDARARPKLSTAAKLFSGTLGAVGARFGIYSDIQAGESTEQAVTSNVGGVLAGAAAGAVIGTAIPIPVVGTVAGAVVGAGVGLFTSGAIDSLFENGPDVGQAFDDGLEALADTGGAIVDAGGSAIDTVGGWFD